MRRALLIDAGQSGCRAALLEDGQVVETASGPGLPRRARSYVPLARMLEARVDVVCAGLTGYAGAGLEGVFDAPVIVTNDAVTAHLGALGGAGGAVILAGTGAIAIAAHDGEIARADGWGTLLGDDGGGYWIGRRGLRLALAGVPAFQAAAEARYGSEIIAAIYDVPDSTARIASFSRDVAGLAESGDADARAIWDEAGRALAATTATAIAAVRGPVPVSWAGGLFAAGELILAPFRDELARLVPGADLRAPLGDGLAGAARLLERPALFASLIEEVLP